MKTYKEMMQERTRDYEWALEAVKKKDWEEFSHYINKALRTHKSSYETWSDIRSGSASEKHMRWSKASGRTPSEHMKRQAQTHKTIVDLWNKHQHNVPKDDPNRRRMNRYMKL